MQARCFFLALRHNGEAFCLGQTHKINSDLSIFFYLMDPLGQFVDAFGKATLAEEVTRKTLDAMDKWEKAGGHAAAGLPRIQ